MDNNLYSQIDLNEIASGWGLLVPSALLNVDDVVVLLAKKIQDMLLNDKRKLYQAFYRLDVDEAKVNCILQTEGVDRQAILLAELVLNREMAKALNRMQHEKKEF